MVLTADKPILENILLDENTLNLLNQCIGYTRSRRREAGFEIYYVISLNSKPDKLIFSKRTKGKKGRVKTARTTTGSARVA